MSSETKLTPTLVTLLIESMMLCIPLVCAGAGVGAVLYLLAASRWHWVVWVTVAPLGYLVWLTLYLAISAEVCRQLGSRYPKPRFVLFNPLKATGTRDELGLLTAFACYRRLAIVEALPFARSLAWIAPLRTLMLRAYSPSAHLGRGALNWGHVCDPDLTEIGAGAVLGGRSNIVAHSATARPDGSIAYTSARVSIGERATVGGLSLVNLGCVIGADCLIEPCSVVPPYTVIPPGEVWGGNPAVRRRLRDEAPLVETSGQTPSAAPASAITMADARALVLEALGLTPDSAPQELTQNTCAAWDSLGQVAIAAALHTHYGISVPPVEVFRLCSLDDVAAAAGRRQAFLVAVEGPRPPVLPRSGSGPVPMPHDRELLPLLDPAEATQLLASRAPGVQDVGEPVSVIIAATFTSQPIAPTLRLWGRTFGLDIDCHFAGYDQIVQTLLGSAGTDSAEHRHVTVILARPEDLAAGSAELSEVRVGQLLDAVQHAAARLGDRGRLLVGTLPPVVSSFTLLDRATVEAIRNRLRHGLASTPRVELFDFGEVVEGLGIDRARSSQSEVLTRGPYSPELYQRLAIALVRQIRSPMRSPAKVLALDCDHTLWGGVVGEVGPAGLELGPEGTGRSFQLFQRYLKQLKERGVLLVIVSKNEDHDVRQVFERHPGMILRPDDISAWRVNWRHKSDNLRELAEELNLGLDAFVFLDDDPTSRLEVQARVPAVHVVPLPEDPAAYCDTLARLWIFDGAAATGVDAARTRMTQEEQQRQAGRSAALSLDDFLLSLELRANLGIAGEEHWPRVAQLTQRTNQFNLSLKRRTSDELQAMGDDTTVLVVDVADRFGDYGLVGACILESRPEDHRTQIDTLVMSCRALGRGVEDAFLHGIAAVAIENGATELVAPVVEGPRNAQVRDFLHRTGFGETQPNVWTRSLRDTPQLPPHVRLRRSGAGPTATAGAMTSILERRRASHPLAVQAFDALLDQMPSLDRSLLPLIARQDDRFWADADDRCGEVLYLCGGDQARLRPAVSAWVEFSMEYLTRQSTFLKTGKYAATSFEQLRQELYADDERMKRFYLVALLFSFLFSANYIGYFRFFREHLLVRLAGARTLCDVGCGHGVYLSQMLLHAPHATGCGLDISDASLATTRSLLQHHDVAAHRYELATADLRGTLPVESASQDAATCFEVLEHLDDPLHALQEIRRILRPGAALCVSAAVRMESVDHLHVFNHPDEVAALLCEAGFRIVAADAYPLSGTPEPGDPGARQAVLDNPRVALGYVALAIARSETST